MSIENKILSNVEMNSIEKYKEYVREIFIELNLFFFCDRVEKYDSILLT